MSHPTTRSVGDPDPPGDHNAMALDVNALVPHPADTTNIHGIVDTAKLALLGVDGLVLPAQLPPAASGAPAWVYYGFASFPGSQPVRPASTNPVIYVSPSQPAGGGTTAGGGNAVNGLDLWFDLP